MNLGGDGRTEQGKAAAEDSEIGSDLGIEVGEAAVHQVAAVPVPERGSSSLSGAS